MKIHKMKPDQLTYPFTNPDRVLYPEQGITKSELANYYYAVKDFILPHIQKRPLTLVRCPKGVQQKCFYQKHTNDSVPPFVLATPIQEKNKIQNYIYIKNYQGLMGLVQMAALEIHPWGSTVTHLEKPDRLIFDLDPAPDVPWTQVIKTAHFMREKFELMGLTSFVKTSGGKGLHIVIPIQRKADWNQIKLISGVMANYFVRLKPEDYTATMTKSKRTGKIFIDYFRNSRGATTVAAYSTRSRKNAPVSTPLAWEELTAKVTSTSFNIHNLPKRLHKLKTDPWQEFFTIQQSLNKAIHFLGELE